MSRVYWLVVGVAFGVALGVVLAQASDPCDNSYNDVPKYQPPSREREHDSAMDFHWSNGQPSLHPQ